MKWDTALRAVGIVGVLAAYGVFVEAGESIYVLGLIVAAIGTLVMPEFVDRMPYLPDK